MPLFVEGYYGSIYNTGQLTVFQFQGMGIYYGIKSQKEMTEGLMSNICVLL